MSVPPTLADGDGLRWRPSPERTGAYITRRVLARTFVPVLVVGPQVDQPGSDDAPALVVCGDGPDPLAPTINAVERWARTFSTSATWPSRWCRRASMSAASATVTSTVWAQALEARGPPTAVEVLNGGDIVERLDEFIEELRNVVYVATTCRYGDGGRHLHSTARAMIRRSRHPVLVVNHDRDVADLARLDPVGRLHPQSWPQRRTVEA